ncbi:hypothetical protein NQ317_003325, partial [Molorchus minor]
MFSNKQTRIITKCHHTSKTDINEDANIACEGLLLSKSKTRYEYTYDCFKKWCVKKNVESISENVILACMLERSNQLKSSASLWCEYSMLKTTLDYKDNVDISKFSKLPSDGLQSIVSIKIANNFALAEPIDEQFTSPCIRNKSTVLKLLVALIIGISGACRCDELFKMKNHAYKYSRKQITIVKFNTYPDFFTVLERNLENAWLRLWIIAIITRPGILSAA